MSKQKERRARLVARLVALMSLTLAAALLWRLVWSVPPPPDSRRAAVPMPAQTLTTAGPRPRPEHEEFNTVERQGLENILRQKNAAAQR